MKHTRTGNPLVDSVAEHNPSSQSTYWLYLHNACYTALPGAFLLLARRPGPSDAGLFLLLFFGGFSAECFAAP